MNVGMVVYYGYNFMRVTERLLRICETVGLSERVIDYDSYSSEDELGSIVRFSFFFTSL